MNGSRGIADVLRGLIALMPVLAWLVVVLAAVAGIFLAGYALVRVYQANASGDGTAGNWLIAAILGSAMTCVTLLIAQFSLYFAA
ncbi:hypothetical protein MKK50_08730 [Methylobacterium sp. J-043]|uniref:hypothetical protein n=1 Tax=Methylorubrum TaxID=2282523 RepID=UPI0020A163AB|nr:MULTISPECIES: hypothetical protein [Methylorubrum]MCJ2029483.1 hypothetical protein [Methylobacterium sp. J-043]MCP1551444.1 putative membrane protein [Methylorubrum zatmanii]MCP1556381.1 putative membrane protein [Methylorubrum extorquens]MCP1581958.1 putative membrane protein [Methylorubrum extorquens]